MSESRQGTAHQACEASAWLGFSERLVRADGSGRITACAEVVAGPYGLRLANIRVALGACDRCPGIDRAAASAVIAGVDWVCQAVAP